MSAIFQLCEPCRPHPHSKFFRHVGGRTHRSVIDDCSHTTRSYGHTISTTTESPGLASAIIDRRCGLLNTALTPSPCASIETWKAVPSPAWRKRRSVRTAAAPCPPISRNVRLDERSGTQSASDLSIRRQVIEIREETPTAIEVVTATSDRFTTPTLCPSRQGSPQPQKSLIRDGYLPSSR